jgi:hypothetical protein
MNNLQCIAMLDVAVDACDLGSSAPNAKLRIYSAPTTVPATADAAITDQVLLAELDMANPAFGASSDSNPGAISTAGAISDDTDANATGTAAFFRIVDRNAVSRLQGSVSITGGSGELQLASLSLVQHTRVEVTSLAFTLPESV